MGGDRYLFVNGAVFGVPGATAVATSGRTITAVGADRQLEDRVGADTEVIDLRGRLITPGFQDAHIHPATAGLELTRCALYDCRDAAEAAAVIDDHARRNPDVPWVLGGGWAMDWYPGGTPTIEELDRLVPDRPAYLRNRDGHGAWVNSAALAAAGITATTPDPVDGRIERAPDGSPQGTLQEGAMDLVGPVMPPVGVADYLVGLEAALAYLLPLGITAWQDAAVDPSIHAAYLELASQGRLPVDVVGALWWERDRGLEQIDELVERRRDAVPGYRATSVKIMLDGVAENFTAAMLEPYLDASGTPSERRGIDFVEPDELVAAVTALDGHGFQVHFHAIGDRAVRHALDAIEAARLANGAGDRRHHIAHIQVIHPDDLPRFAALGAVANAQPFWACSDGYQTDLTIPFLGSERAAWQYPFRSLLRAGARLAMGSDWSVSTPNPMLEMEVAVTRREPQDRLAEPFYPEECIGLDDAMLGFTAGSAFVNHRDDSSGSIAVGFAADLVVLDRNPFEADAGPAGEAVVDMTMIGGAIVHAREASG
ncbi:MAG: amidohydrolase [Acidimicrobiia bacterium]